MEKMRMESENYVYKKEIDWSTLMEGFTKLFGSQEVLAYVTATEKEHGTKRLFSVRFFQKNSRFSVYGRKKHR